MRSSNTCALPKIDDTLEAGKYVYVDVDEDGVPLGLEILFAGRLLNQ